MPQLLLPGMHEGAIRINSVVSRLSKDGQVTWLLGSDNYFSHPADDSAGQRLALATLMANGHARPCQIHQTLGTAMRSLVRRRKQLDAQGAGSFYQLRGVRGTAVFTVETSDECQCSLAEGRSIAATARLAGTKEALCARPSLQDESQKPTPPAKPPRPTPPTRPPNPNTAAPMPKPPPASAPSLPAPTSAAPQPSAWPVAPPPASNPLPTSCSAESFAACPGHCANGLFCDLDRHLTLPKGYYSALHILCVLGFMALARIRRPRATPRPSPSGELGKAIGLNRVAEVRTLREKIAAWPPPATPANGCATYQKPG